MLASQSGHIEIVKLLIAAGGEEIIHAKDKVSSFLERFLQFDNNDYNIIFRMVRQH